ncbi:uncharacterized protein LOC131255323 [Magnolia sinica]|uniref:uncharacterized protein LOC131255323 n=1 Tax=Magnolia sinica TaxID=86752 RepID=UPI00265B2181|nr:uncharacterized protein LOC131255323 [Magnolia sinica]
MIFSSRSTSSVLKISHLLYADDTMIFSNRSTSSVRILKGFLHSFMEASVLKINPAKSSFIVSSKMATNRIYCLERESSFLRSSLPFLYIGVPLSKGRIQASTFQPLVEKILARISGWKARFLNQGARIVLIKHVLLSIPIHSLAVVDIPKQTLCSLEKGFTDFFWGWSEGKKNLHWVNWKTIVGPSKGGGLGIKGVRDVSSALKLKRAWTIFVDYQSNLWAKFMRTKYEAVLVEISVKKKGIHLASSCVCCTDNSCKEESLDHLFVDSEIAFALWSYF